MTTSTTAAPVVITKGVLASATPTTEVYDLPEEFAPMLDELSNVRYARAEAQKREKELKAELLDLLPARKLGVKYVFRILGVVKGNVRMDSKDKVDLGLLLTAFPEAYAAIVTPDGTQYDVVNPA